MINTTQFLYGKHENGKPFEIHSRDHNLITKEHLGERLELTLVDIISEEESIFYYDFDRECWRCQDNDVEGFYEEITIDEETFKLGRKIDNIHWILFLDGEKNKIEADERDSAYDKSGYDESGFDHDWDIHDEGDF